MDKVTNNCPSNIERNLWEEKEQAEAEGRWTAPVLASGEPDDEDNVKEK